MSISSYPSGFRGGALIKNVPIFDQIDGNVFWVDSGTGGAGNPGTFTQPLATIQQGIGKCTANNNDVVFVKAGHAETLANATTLTPNIAGVSVIGLGRGTSRPTLTFSAAGSSVAVSAANVTFQNFVCHATGADVADAFTPTATNLVVKDVVFTNSGAGFNWVELADTSTTDAEADGLTFERIHWYDPDLSTTSVVNVRGNIDRLAIKDSYVKLGINVLLSALVNSTAGSVLTNLNLDGNFVNRLVSDNAIQLVTCADGTTAHTGAVTNNMCATRDVSGALFVTAATNFHVSHCLSTSAVDKSGFIENADS